MLHALFMLFMYSLVKYAMPRAVFFFSICMRCVLSQELVRGTTVCVCHFLELAVATVVEEADQQQQQQQPEEAGGAVTGDTDEDGGDGGAVDEGHKRSHPLGEVISSDSQEAW